MKDLANWWVNEGVS